MKLLLLVLSLFASFAAAQTPDYLNADIQAPVPVILPPYASPPTQAPPVNTSISRNCLSALLARLDPCLADPALEWRLEQEYWYLIGSVDPKSAFLYIDNRHRVPTTVCRNRHEVIPAFNERHVVP